MSKYIQIPNLISQLSQILDLWWKISLWTIPWKIWKTEKYPIIRLLLYKFRRKQTLAINLRKQKLFWPCLSLFIQSVEMAKRTCVNKKLVYFRQLTYSGFEPLNTQMVDLTKMNERQFKTRKVMRDHTCWY